MGINAGQRVSADDLNGLAPLDIIKPADQNYTNTTLANDNDLVQAVEANATYSVLICLLYEGGASGSSDMKVGFSVPTSATLRLSNQGTNAAGGSTGSFAVTEATTATGQTSGAGSLRMLVFIGSLVTGGTAGNFQLKACQNTANATAVIIHAQSTMSLQKVG